MATSTSRRPFEFVANHIVLDFVNTVNARPVFSRDDLACPDDIVEWAHTAGVFGRHDGMDGGMDGGMAGEMASSIPTMSQFEAAVVLRERLYRVFGPIAAGHEPHREALVSVVQTAAGAIRSAQWTRGTAGFEPEWPASVDSLRDRLADEAVRLLRSPDVYRVGSCDGCGWLFLDTSRAHARRWCSMNVCGARHKMRRYHHRQTSSAATR